MTPGPAILQLLPHESSTAGTICSRSFEKYGLPLTTLPDLTRVVGHIRSHEQSADPRIVTIIDARERQHRTAVSTLRAMCAHMGIIAVVDPDKEADIINLLQVGVDLHCPA